MKMGITNLIVCDRCGLQEIASELKENWAWFYFEELSSEICLETKKKSKPKFYKGKRLLCPACTETIGSCLAEITKAK